MVKLIALYKRPADPAAFDKYYYATHKPLAEKIPGLVDYKCSKVFGSPAGKSPWYFVAEMFFKDKESFKAGMTSPEAMAAGKDVNNFAKDLCEMLFIDEQTAVPVSR